MAAPKMERLPKGFGGVIKMNGKRSRPFMVRVKVGTYMNVAKEKAYPEYKIIGYAKSRKDGILMLQQYHDNPYDFENKITFAEMYQKAFKEFVADKSRSSKLAYEASFKACEELHPLIFKDIKTAQLQHALDHSGKNYPTLKKIKVLFNIMYKYAMKYDLCPKDYSKYVDVTKHQDKNPDKVDRNPFTKDDIDKLWHLSNDKWFQIPLMLIYTGVRISELLELKKEHVNLEEQCFDIVKSKTENGIRRVPIADCILPFFKEWYEHSEADTLLCMPNGKPFKYRNYFDAYWTPILDPIGMSEYTPHCTRHTCISLLAEAKVDQTTIKMIVGHRGAMSLTERVYTHLDVQTLLDAINTIYVPDYIKNKE